MSATRQLSLWHLGPRALFVKDILLGRAHWPQRWAVAGGLGNVHGCGGTSGPAAPRADRTVGLSRRTRAVLTVAGGAHMVRPPFQGARSSAAEHLTFNQRVDGSIPSGLTTSLACDLTCASGAASKLHVAGTAGT